VERKSNISHTIFLLSSGTWGLPQDDKKEVKEVKRIVKQALPKEEKHCGPWGVHSVHELEDVMGLE
jgi:hypothetical protein